MLHSILEIQRTTLTQRLIPLVLKPEARETGLPTRGQHNICRTKKGG